MGRPLIHVDAEDILAIVYALTQIGIGGEMTQDQKDKLLLLETRLERKVGFNNA